MRALVWHGKEDIRCDTVPDPKIEEPRDAIVKVTSCAICGSDLHLYDGLMPGMKSGDIRWLSWRAGRIPPRSFRRYDPHQGPERPIRRTASLPQRHLPDWVAGGRPV